MPGVPGFLLRSSFLEGGETGVSAEQPAGGAGKVLSLLLVSGWQLERLRKPRKAATAAAAAASLQSCLTLCDPIDGSPPGSPVPGILQARILECVAISFSNA